MAIYKNFFVEDGVPGRRLGKIEHHFLIEKLIFDGKTSYQKVLIFDNPLYGRIFCLDEIVQFSESDEFIYHEMISHPVLFSHPNPKNILIIGGGDGGVLREVLKHGVERVDLTERDKEIINLTKKYLKFVCRNCFSDKRVKIFNVAGEEFIKKYESFYDIVIIDCTNFNDKSISCPLCSLKFYKNVFVALKEEGMMITLGASFLDFENMVKKIFSRLKKIFPFVSIIKFCMPSYNCGEYCFLTASKKIDLTKVDFNKISRKFERLRKKHKFRYYSPEIHQASMILPVLHRMR